MVHAGNPSTWEAEGLGLLFIQVSLGYIVNSGPTWATDYIENKKAFKKKVVEATELVKCLPYKNENHLEPRTHLKNKTSMVAQSCNPSLLAM